MMRGKWFLVSVLLLGLMLGAVVGLSMAQGEESEGGAAPQALVGTAFTYQGRLNRGGSAYSGECGFRFSLHDALSDGNQVGNTQTIGGVDVEGGLFTVALNSGNEFGDGAFTGEGRWLAIAVQCSGDGTYTALSPRQELTPAPYALALPGLWTEQHTTSPNVIGGYRGNSVADGQAGATIGGGGESGHPNQVTAVFATIGGGRGNTASGRRATVGGGANNTAGDPYATVGGGGDNSASGEFATVPGGRYNTAEGDYSFAAGRRAKALHDGTIILADSNDFDFSSIVPNSFKVRATGGIRFVLGIDDQGAHTWSCLVNDGTSWSCTSDRNRKENLQAVDGSEILQRLSRVPIFTWNGKGLDPAVRHMGPMAQDFYAAFGLGQDDQHLATIDLDGVALAAIQALYEHAQAQAQRIELLEGENAALEAQFDEIEARLSALEAAVSAGEAGP